MWEVVLSRQKQDLLPISTQYSSEGFSVYTQYEKDNFLFLWILSIKGGHRKFFFFSPLNQCVGAEKIISGSGSGSGSNFSDNSEGCTLEGCTLEGCTLEGRTLEGRTHEVCTL